MRDPSRVEVPGPLESYAEDFRGELAGRGYSPDAAAVHLQVMGHLSRWLAGRGLDSSGLTPAVVDAYLTERRSLGCASHWTRRALAPLLEFLQRREVAPAEVTPGPAAGPVEALLGRYARWLAEERGLARALMPGAHPQFSTISPRFVRRVQDHHDAGADHVCMQVFDADPHGLPMRQWKELATALF